MSERKNIATCSMIAFSRKPSSSERESNTRRQLPRQQITKIDPKEYLPSDIPANLIDVVVKKGQLSAYNPEDAYRMESKPRGLCMIVNNRVFDHLSERKGTDVDAQNLRFLFEDLGFSVLPDKKDKTVKEMREDLEFFASRTDHHDCVAVIILSHGAWRNGDTIHGVDSKPKDGATLNFNELLKMFGSKDDFCKRFS